MSQERLKQTIERVNASLAAQIEHAREALSGAQPFEAGHVEQLRSTIEEMTAITTRSGEVRRSHLEIANDLDRYVAQLRTLQSIVRQLEIVLLLRQCKLRESESQHLAVSRWANAAQQTR
jgi:hypothetical protein